MTIKDLQRIISEKYGSPIKENPELIKLAAALKDKPFYCNSNSGTKCNGGCTWHTFTPMNNKDEPSDLHPFQRDVIADLEQHKRISVLKCRNAGLSQLALTYALHLSLSKQIPGNYIFITGVGQILSKSLALRVRAMCADKRIFFDDNLATLTFPNNIRWSFFPSDSKAYRGQSDIVYLCADELTEFEDSQQWRASIDTFAIKNKGATMLLITTPSYNLNSLAYKLFNEPEDKSLYKHVYINYEKCLGTMLDVEQTNLLKATSPTFQTEFNLKWAGGLYGSGNCFDSNKIDQCILKEKDYTDETLRQVPVSVGCDPAFSADGSKFAITCMCVINGLPHVTDAVQYSGLDFNLSIEKLFNLLSLRYNWYRGNINFRIYVDSANPHWIRSACQMVGQREEFELDLGYARKHNIPLESTLTIIPVAFNSEGLQMLQMLQTMISDTDLRIPVEYTDLIQQLKVARVKPNQNLDKSKHSLDLVDSTRLSATGIRRMY